MRRRSTLLLSVLLTGLVSCQQVFAQRKTQKPQQEQADDVVRVKTELVQTDITVVDKRGRFVDGLRADDFELLVDSKPQKLSFFEKVAAGSVEEEKQLTAARKGSTADSKKTPERSASKADRGRVVFFFVDDVHLTAESLTRARTALTHFVENQMTARDRVAVVSTSGQIGFLQ